MNLKKLDVKCDFDLRNSTTMKIAAKASRFFIVHDVAQLQKLISSIEGPYYLLGGGSNVLIRDNAIVSRPIIKLGDDFSYIKKRGCDSIETGAATPLRAVMYCMIKQGLSGLETLAGIPATIGGLLAMNASAFGKAVSDCLTEVEAMDRRGNVMCLRREEITFGYRYSSLKGMVILRAWFKFEMRKDVKESVRMFLKARRCTQDFFAPSCGCIFKNPEGYKAGFLIESCGFKGKRKNDAQVSLRHANFIVNTGNAQYGDVDFLIREIKERVFDAFKVELEEEVERWV